MKTSRLLVLSALICTALCSGQAQAESLRVNAPHSVSDSNELSQSFSVARSSRLTGIAWYGASPLRPFSSATSRSGRVQVKVRGADGKFGQTTSFGSSMARSPQLVASHGRLLLTYVESNGRVKYSIKRPQRKWSRVRNVGRIRIGGYVLKSGQNGTALLVGKKKGTHKIVAARLSPRSNRLRPIGRISRSPSSVGLFLDVAVDRKGRGFAIWSGPCPLSDAKAQKNATVVVISRRGKARNPRRISNSKCPSVGVSIEASGVQVYAKIDGNAQPVHQSVRVARKRPGEWFQPARKVNAAGTISLNGQLVALPGGGASVIMPDLIADPEGWTRTAFSVATARRQSRFRKPFRVEGIGGQHVLLASSAFAPGRILAVWQSIETWTLEATLLSITGKLLDKVHIESVDEDQLTKAAVAPLIGKRNITLVWGPTMSLNSQIGIGDLQIADVR